MGDAIVGDLHEEFVDEVERRGPARARAAYRRRAAGVVAHAVVDALCARAWASVARSAEWPHAAVTAPVAPRAVVSSGTSRGAVAGVLAATLGVLAVGIVANTLLFDSVRHVPRAAPSAGATHSALGVAAVVLSLVCAGAAAVVLCAGPRWLRRRAATARRAEPAA